MTLDLKLGYWEVVVLPKDRKYTEFTTGCFWYFMNTREPMGLCNSSATFQRMMEPVMGSLNLEVCTLYLDDMILYAKYFDSHLFHLALVLAKIKTIKILFISVRDKKVLVTLSSKMVSGQIHQRVKW